MSLYYARLAQKAGVPVRIAHSHNSALRKSAGRLLKLGIHRFFSLRCTDSATDLWACSGEAAAFMFPREALRKRSYRFIPNGIDTARFRFRGDVRAQVREELGLEGAFVVGHVGRLCYQKNQRFLLSLLPALLRLRPESRLLLVGEGEDLDGLRRYAGELGISDKVIFYGVSRQVETLLWAMDAFALPSRFEGLSIVAVEAQAAGLPLLCSEAVTKEAGITGLARWEPLDPELWAKLLAGMPDAERQSGADGVRDAGFDVARVAKCVEEAYRCI
jgi:glycosyltransferase involved in cell wall biosynthesis